MGLKIVRKLDSGAEKVLNVASFSQKNQVVESQLFKNVISLLNHWRISLAYFGKYLLQ